MKFIKSMFARSAKLKDFKDILVCDKCESEEIMVHDTRIIQGIKRRRRICAICGNKTTTYEISKEDLELLLAKENEHDGE